MVGKNIHTRVIKSNIVQTMLVRRMAVLQDDMTEEEIDSLISETGREWMAKTENMSITDVMMEMLMQSVQHKSEMEESKKELNESM